MFIDFSQYQAKNAEKASLAGQANRHTALVKFLQDLSSLMKISNLGKVYQAYQEQASKAFEHNKKICKVSTELEYLVNVRTNSRSYHRSYQTQSYSLNTHQSASEIVYERKEELTDIHHTIGNVLTKALEEITKKEVYIRHTLGYTNQQEEEDKVNDTVIDMNGHISNVLTMCNTYRLKYVNSNTRDNVLGFIKQVKSFDPMNIDPEISIDKNWFDTVFSQNKQILEYQGARTFTLSLDLIRNDAEKTLYSAKCIQIKGTREQVARANNYWRQTNWTHIGPLFKTLDLVLCESKPTHDNSKTHWALGSNADKAYSVMKRRQKLDMMKTLNL